MAGRKVVGTKGKERWLVVLSGGDGGVWDVARMWWYLGRRKAVTNESEGMERKKRRGSKE